MNDYILSQRSKDFHAVTRAIATKKPNEAMKLACKFYGSEVNLLIKMLQEQGLSLQKIADRMGVTKQALSLRLLKEEHDNA